MTRWPQNEEQLASPVVTWLEAEHWDVYQEVQIFAYAHIADIVALQGPVIWVIETKRSLGFRVCEQACQWQQIAHLVSVAVPLTERGRGPFASRILHNFGLGLITVREHGEPHELVPARLCRRTVQVLTARLRAACTEERKHFAAAGNAEGLRYTPFSATCRAVLVYVMQHPGAMLKEVVDGIDHHYRADTTARSCLSTWIRAGKVRGVVARREGRLLRIYPADVAAEAEEAKETE